MAHDFKSRNKTVRLISEYSLLNLEQGDFPYNVPYYKSHQKHRINKAYRKHKDRQSVIFDCKEHVFPKKDMIYLRDKMIKKGSRKHGFLNDERLSLIENLYNSGLVVLHFVKKGDCVNSCNIILKSSYDRFMFWIDLYDDVQMINIFSYVVFMKHFSSEHPLFVNFGRGRYFYKYSNFVPIFNNLYKISIYHNSFSKIYFDIISFMNAAFRYIYKKIR